jgi:phosphoribosylformylglycinamidine cyclo-ligase
MKPVDYRSSGVDISEGEKAVSLMKERVRRTFNSSVLSDLGHFGGLYRADFGQMKDPVIVASTDGVGTKLKIAGMMQIYSTVGRDLINHCVNDILVQGASPLFFMDYIACGRLRAETVAEIVSGLADGCIENGCALLGGETAEMPGFYDAGDYDVAGTVIGIVQREMIIDGSEIQPGMVVIGLPSSGLHTNGYSLARRVIFEVAGLSPSDSHPDLGGTTVGEALLAVHRSYLLCLQPLLSQKLLKGIAHITGGGIPGNLSRILPEGCGALIRPDWGVPAIFEVIRELGQVETPEMRKAFNMGAGMLLVADMENKERVMTLLKAEGEDPFIAGEITYGSSIEYDN